MVWGGRGGWEKRGREGGGGVLPWPPLSCLSTMLVCWSCHTNTTDWVTSTTGMYFLTALEARESKVKASVGLFSSDAFPPWLADGRFCTVSLHGLFSVHVHPWGLGVLSASFFFFFFGCTHGMQKFADQQLNPYHRSDNAGL